MGTGSGLELGQWDIVVKLGHTKLFLFFPTLSFQKEIMMAFTFTSCIREYLSNFWVKTAFF